MLDEIKASRGEPKTTIPQFNRFYAEFDVNNDGLISKTECARFVKKFITPSGQLTIGLLQPMTVSHV
jgi:hypothetical protein